MAAPLATPLTTPPAADTAPMPLSRVARLWAPLAASWMLSKGSRGALLLHFLLGAGLFIGGILLLGVGVLVAMPVFWFSQAWLFHRLAEALGDDGADEPAAAVA